MMVYGEAFETDPDYVEGQTEFWCLCTSGNHGPDGRTVSLAECSNPERSCFQEF
jgi:hypothetical protein